MTFISIYNSFCVIIQRCRFVAFLWYAGKTYKIGKRICAHTKIALHSGFRVYFSSFPFYCICIRRIRLKHKQNVQEKKIKSTRRRAIEWYWFALRRWWRAQLGYGFVKTVRHIKNIILNNNIHPAENESYAQRRQDSSQSAGQKELLLLLLSVWQSNIPRRNNHHCARARAVRKKKYLESTFGASICF